jgi:hypothetical protein
VRPDPETNPAFFSPDHYQQAGICDAVHIFFIFAKQILAIYKDMFIFPYSEPMDRVKHS